MDFDLLQPDEGVQISARLWNPHLVPEPQFRLDVTNANVYMLVLKKEALGASARAFDMIDRTKSPSGLQAALLQFWLRTCELIVAEYRTVDKTAPQDSPYPIHMFVETVVESHANAAKHKSASAGDVGVRRGIVRSIYDLDVTAEALAAMYPDHAVDDSPLLGDCRDRAALEYRFWICAAKTVNFPAKLEAVMKLAEVEHEKYTAATTLAIDNRSLERYRKLTADGASTGDFAISNLLAKNEQWAVINSTNALLDALFVYTGDRALLGTGLRTQALSSVKPLSHADNPAYLGAVFSAALQFRDLDPRIDAAQSCWADYVQPVVDERRRPTGATVLRFPRATRTLLVPPEFHNRSLIYRYVPDYQIQSAQSRSVNNALQRAQRDIAEGGPAVVSRTTAALNAIRNAKAQGLIVDASDAAAEEEESNGAQLAGGLGRPERPSAAEALQAAVDASEQSDLSISEQNALTTGHYLAQNAITQTFTRDSGAQLAGGTAAVNALVLGPSRYTDPSVLRQRAEIDNSLAGHVEVTTMHTIAKHYRAEHARCREALELQERCVRHTLIVEAAMRDYAQSCTNALAQGMSAPCRTINAFLQRAASLNQNCFHPIKFFDERLSMFGHMMVRETTIADRVYHTHSVHKGLIVGEVALFAAYRVAHELSFNALFTGPPEGGKSRIIEHTEKRAVPGTTITVARRTAASFSVSESHNDACEAYHETPRNFLIDPAELTATTGGPSRGPANDGGKEMQQHEMFKSKLTSMMVRTPAPVLQADGSYKEHVRISECMMTYLCATNLDAAMVASAIRSRFFMMELSNFKRRDATIADKSLDEQNESRELKALRERCDWEFRLRQALTMHVNKLIDVGALTEPTLTTLMVFLPIFVRVFEDDFSIRVPIRSLIKMELLVRHLVIQRAIFALYVAPNAPFAGQRVAIEHLARADPLLYDDPELVFYAFEFMRTQYIDPNIAVVSRALRVHLAQHCATPAGFERFRRNHFKAAGAKRTADDGYRAAQTALGAFLGQSADGGGGGLMGSGEPPATWATASIDDTRYDFGRCMLRQRTDSLCVELEKIIAETETLRLTPTQIDRTLLAMTRQSVHDYPYEPNTMFDGTMTDKALPVLPMKNRPKASSLLVEINHTHGIVSVHASLLADAQRDPIEAVIQACIDANMPSCKMLRGDPNAPDLPHIYGVREVRPQADVFHVCADRASFSPSTLCMMGEDVKSGADTLSENDDKAEAAARSRMKRYTSSVVVLGSASVAEYSVRRRMEVLNLPSKVALGFSFAYLEAQIRSNDANFVPPAERIEYPADVNVTRSQSDVMNLVRKQMAGMTTDEAKREIGDRVSLIASSFRGDADEERVAEWLAAQGFDERVGRQVISAWETEAAEAQRARDVKNSAIRAEVELINKEEKARLAAFDAEFKRRQTKLARTSIADRAPVGRARPPAAPAPQRATTSGTPRAARSFSATSSAPALLGAAPWNEETPPWEGADY